jgi:hypothetical protein
MNDPLTAQVRRLRQIMSQLGRGPVRNYSLYLAVYCLVRAAREAGLTSTEICRNTSPQVLMELDALDPWDAELCASLWSCAMADALSGREPETPPAELVDPA